MIAVSHNLISNFSFLAVGRDITSMLKFGWLDFCVEIMQGGITCGAIDDPSKSSKAIDERVIINFRDKNVVIARFRDKNVYR